MNRDTVARFLGGSPGSVLVRLVAMSFVLGIILNALGVSPFDIVNGLRQLARRIYDMGFETLVWMWRYFLVGAVVVLPVWLIIRVLKVGRRGGF